MARRFAFWVLCFSGPLSAAPILRVANSVVGPITVSVAAPPTTQTLDAFNIGDGALALSVTVAPSIAWLTASVGAADACTSVNLKSCIPLRFTLNTAALASGTYTASVTIEDPHAIDSPQVVTVTVHVGATEVTAVDEVMSPGTTRDVYFSPGGSAVASTRDGGIWLSVAVDAFSTLRYFWSYRIHLAPPAGMAPGTYMGAVAISGSTNNRTIPVTMRLTAQPIAVTSTNSIDLRRAANELSFSTADHAKQ